MKFDNNPEKTSNKTNNKPSILKFQLPTVPLNLQIPKNNLGAPEEDSQSWSSTPTYNPIAYMFSPTPQDLSYTSQSPSHYKESNLDWGEPSFGFGMEPLEENIPQNNTNPPQSTATLSNEKIDQMHPSIPMAHQQSNGSKLISSNQDKTQKAAPTLSGGTPKNKYESLEEALIDWINSLSVKIATKRHYKMILIKLIRLLDSKGIYTYNEVEISDYCDCHLKNIDRKNLRDFKSAAKRFFDWAKRMRIYDKIAPKDAIDNDLPENNLKPQCEPQETTQLIGKSLSKIFYKWARDLQGDVSTKASYKAQMLDFVIFLTAIKTLQPTKQNIINFFRGKLKIRGSTITREYRQAIKSFLQAIEQMGFPQDPEVYDFLDGDTYT